MKTLVLFTNRNTLVLNEQGKQCPEDQNIITCYSIDVPAARELIAQCDKFQICKWRVWTEEITKKEMEYLLGLRTREMDL